MRGMLKHAIAAIALCLLAAFFFTAVIANEWGAWAPPGKDNPNYAQLRFNANFYRVLCFSALAGALIAAVRGYLKSKQSPPATHD
jgi:hypothetical protein